MEGLSRWGGGFGAGCIVGITRGANRLPDPGGLQGDRIIPGGGGHRGRNPETMIFDKLIYTDELLGRFVFTQGDPAGVNYS